MYIINSYGEKELFSEEKLRKSIERVADSKELADEAFKLIKKQIRAGMKTYEIFKIIKKVLSKTDKRGALKVNIKEGLRKLGPTGFPFEKFIGEVFKERGYEVKINQHIPGHCLADYEIDLVARKDNLIYVGECKYRNLVGDRVHQRDALANYARFQDIMAGPYFKKEEYKGCTIKTALITNTKFTENAYNYSTCAGVNLLGWKTPQDEGLEYLIDKYKLYPITVLFSLKGFMQEIFLSEGIMLVKDLVNLNAEKFSKKFKIPISQLNAVIKEANLLYS